jgi:hypothetical protein
MLTVRYNEQLFLFSSQEIDPKTNMHNIRGVERLPWSNEDSLYFRTEDTWFNNIWSVLHGKGLYFPEYVAGAVPSNITPCTIVSYWHPASVFYALCQHLPQDLGGDLHQMPGPTYKPEGEAGKRVGDPASQPLFYLVGTVILAAAFLSTSVCAGLAVVDIISSAFLSLAALSAVTGGASGDFGTVLVCAQAGMTPHIMIMAANKNFCIVPLLNQHCRCSSQSTGRTACWSHN